MSELFTGGGFQTAAASLSTTAAPAPASDPSPAAAGASPAPASSSTQTAAPDGTSPAVPPAVPADPAQAAAKPQGPIPFDTHKTALENARTKAAQETEAKYGWATAIAPEHRDTVGQFYKLLDADPTQAVDVLISQIANDPVHAPKLRSLFGRLLGTRQSQPGTPQGGFPEPDTEGVDDQGNRIPLYSAATMPKIIAELERRLDAKYSQKYGPLEQDFQTRQQQQHEATAKAEAVQWADQEYARVSKYPHYQEHEPAIAAAMQADEQLTIQDAYIRIVVPTLDRTARQEVAASLHDKASASALNPAHPTSAAPTRPKTFAEALSRLPAGSL